MNKNEINYEDIGDWLKKYHDCQNNRQKQQLSNMIVFACMPIVKKVVFSIARRCSDPIEDLIQVGTLGLVKAIHKYNTQFENLKTYLFYSILWEIKHHLRNVALQEGATYKNIGLALRANKFDIEEIDEDISTHSEDEISQSKKIIERRQVISLDDLQFTDENNLSTLGDKIVDNSNEYMQEVNENKIIIEKAIKQLPDRLQSLVKKLYYDGYSQAQLARRWETSQSNISRMQKRAINLLSDIIKNELNEDENGINKK